MAGQLNLRTVQLGDSADASKNFLISTPAVPDGTLTIERADGTDVLTVDTSGRVSTPGNGLLLLTKKLTGTTPSSAGGTSAVAHGIADHTKIRSARMTFSYNGTDCMQNDYIGSTVGTYSLSLTWNATNITIVGHAANAAGALNKACTILVWYEA